MNNSFRGYTMKKIIKYAFPILIVVLFVALLLLVCYFDTIFRGIETLENSVEAIMSWDESELLLDKNCYVRLPSGNSGYFDHSKDFFVALRAEDIENITIAQLTANVEISPFVGSLAGSAFCYPMENSSEHELRCEIYVKRNLFGQFRVYKFLLTTYGNHT